MSGGVSTNHKSLKRIELCRLGQDLFNCWSFDLTKPIDHKSLNPIELCRLGQDLFNCWSFDLTKPDLTKPIDPLTHPTTHPWVGVSYKP